MGGSVRRSEVKNAKQMTGSVLFWIHLEQAVEQFRKIMSSFLSELLSVPGGNCILTL
jgi:hypothetical protein